METFVKVQAIQKGEIYQEIIPQIESLIHDETDLIANLSNISAVLKMAFSSISWVGFYLHKENELVLGPFQGKPACVRIAIGKGVCGTSAELRKTIIVSDVNQFPGHIFCDPDSKSEIVVPIIKNGQLFGVLDVDSASFGSFDETDEKFLEQIIELLKRKL